MAAFQSLSGKEIFSSCLFPHTALIDSVISERVNINNRQIIVDSALLMYI